LAAFKPFYTHDALYRLLHDGALNIGDDIRVLETLSKALPPAFRQAIKDIGLSLDPDEVPRILMLLRPENYPGLELVSVVVWPYSDGSGEIPCVKRCYDAADRFKKSLLVNVQSLRMSFKIALQISRVKRWLCPVLRPMAKKIRRRNLF